MSNSIWNKYDIKDMPDENKLVVLVDKDDGFYNAHFVDKIDWINDWYDHIEKWCYLDDLIAQVDKAERLQKENDAMREEFEVWHGNYKCEVEEKERLQRVVFFLIGHLRDVLQLDEYGHIKLDEITKQQIKTAISDPVGIIMQLEQESNN